MDDLDALLFQPPQRGLSALAGLAPRRTEGEHLGRRTAFLVAGRDRTVWPAARDQGDDDGQTQQEADENEEAE